MAANVQRIGVVIGTESYGTKPYKEQVSQLRISVRVLGEEPIARFALEGLVRTQSDFAVQSESEDSDTPSVIDSQSQDIVIVDLHSSGPTGLDIVKRLRAEQPTSLVVLLSHDEHDWSLLDALRLGVRGYLYKTASPDALFEAIRVVHSGQTYLDPTVHAAVATASADEGERDTQLGHDLSDREKEILQLVAQGRTNAEIGRLVFLSQSTIKYHLNSAYRKLGASNRAAAAMKAVELGLIASSLPSSNPVKPKKH